MDDAPELIEVSSAVPEADHAHDTPDAAAGDPDIESGSEPVTETDSPADDDRADGTADSTAEAARPVAEAPGDGPAWASPADLLGWLEKHRAEDRPGSAAEQVAAQLDIETDTETEPEVEGVDPEAPAAAEPEEEADGRGTPEPPSASGEDSEPATEPEPATVPVPESESESEPEPATVPESEPATVPESEPATVPESPDDLAPAAEPEPQPEPAASVPDVPSRPTEAWFDSTTEAPTTQAPTATEAPTTTEAPTRAAPEAEAAQIEAAQIEEPQIEEPRDPVPTDVFARSASPRPVPLPVVDATAVLDQPPALPPPSADSATAQPGPAQVPTDVPPLPPTVLPSAHPGQVPPGSAPPVAVRRPRRGRWVAAAVLAVGLIGGGGAAAAARGQVPRGTTIGGVEVGGLDRADAIRALAERAPSSAAPIQVSVGGRQASLDPRSAGLSLDAERSVDAVLGGALDPMRIWQQIIGGSEQPALPEADRSVLRAALEPIAEDTRQAAEDGGITFTSSGATAVAAVIGSELDVDAATEAIANGWLARAGTLDLPVTLTSPAIRQAEVDRALKEVATPAATGSLTVVIGATTITVPEVAVRPTLRMAPATDKPGTLELVVDGAGLRSAVLAVGPSLEQKPKDAMIVLKDGVPTVIPSKDGVTVDPEKLAAAAKAALLTPERKVVLDSAVAKPKLTTEQAKALGVKERVSTFSTHYPPNVPRTNNLRIAARTVNGTLVPPGQTFSLNQVLGQRTPEKGYAEAPTIMNGRLVMGHGGGVSQMATTIYNNVFFSGLEDVSHTPHSFYISRYPEGREATVNYPNVDLKWRNDSPYAVLIEASVTSTVNVSFWSTKQYDDVISSKSERTNHREPKTVYDPRPNCVSQDANPGFDVVVRRKVIKDGAVVKDQSWRTSYLAEDTVVCGPKPDPAAASGGTVPGGGAPPD